MDKHTLTIGIEEELFIVDENSLELVTKVPDVIFDRFNERYPKQLVGEFLPAQVEIISTPCETLPEIRNQLAHCRKHLIEVCAAEGLKPVAISTHPQGKWVNQVPRDNPRYNRIAERLRVVINRLLVCGCHIHVGVDDPEKRLRVNNQITEYLPYILSLSTSSPFWGGYDTGLNSYRLCVMHTLPRTGMPPLFKDFAEYEEYIAALVAAREISDASEIWWDSRLSGRFPTVEMRITDTCTRFRDLIAVASFTKSLVHYLLRHPEQTSQLSRLMSKENSWLAQRYSISSIDLIADVQGNRRKFSELITEMLDIIGEDAKMLDCYQELQDVKLIISEGTSADRQREIYQKARQGGAMHDAALSRVIAAAVAETAMDVL